MYVRILYSIHVQMQKHSLVLFYSSKHKEGKQNWASPYNINHFHLLFCFQLAENLDGQLARMGEDLKEIISHLNTSAKSQDSKDPVYQIGNVTKNTLIYHWSHQLPASAGALTPSLTPPRSPAPPPSPPLRRSPCSRWSATSTTRWSCQSSRVFPSTSQLLSELKYLLYYTGILLSSGSTPTRASHYYLI